MRIFSLSANVSEVSIRFDLADLGIVVEQLKWTFERLATIIPLLKLGYKIKTVYSTQQVFPKLIKGSILL